MAGSMKVGSMAGIAGRVDIGANGFWGNIEIVKTHGLAIENIRGMQRSAWQKGAAGTNLAGCSDRSETRCSNHLEIV